MLFCQLLECSECHVVLSVLYSERESPCPKELPREETVDRSSRWRIRQSVIRHGNLEMQDVDHVRCALVFGWCDQKNKKTKAKKKLRFVGFSKVESRSTATCIWCIWRTTDTTGTKWCLRNSIIGISKIHLAQPSGPPSATMSLGFHIPPPISLSRLVDSVGFSCIFLPFYPLSHQTPLDRHSRRKNEPHRMNVSWENFQIALIPNFTDYSRRKSSHRDQRRDTSH